MPSPEMASATPSSTVIAAFSKPVTDQTEEPTASLAQRVGEDGDRRDDDQVEEQLQPLVPLRRVGVLAGSAIAPSSSYAAWSRRRHGVETVQVPSGSDSIE